MSVSYGFYNSIEGDRVYNAAQFQDIFDGMFTDGVFANYEDKFEVNVYSGMYVSVGKGKAWFNGVWVVNDSLLVLPVSPSDSILNRIDAVVIEIDKNERVSTIKMVSGTPGYTPSRPELIKSDGVYQYALSYIYVRSQSYEIVGEDITSVIGNEETPYATGSDINPDDLVEEIVQEITSSESLMLDNVYPIGSIYMSVNSVSPETLFGGIWEAINGRFLLGAGIGTDSRNETKRFDLGATSGELVHTLTLEETPSHTHNGTTSENSHTHTYSDDCFSDYTDGYALVAFEYDNVLDGIRFKSLSTIDTKESLQGGAHNHNIVNVSSVGGGGSHENLPPYLAVYIWKRIG